MIRSKKIIIALIAIAALLVAVFPVSAMVTSYDEGYITDSITGSQDAKEAPPEFDMRHPAWADWPDAPKEVKYPPPSGFQIADSKGKSVATQDGIGLALPVQLLKVKSTEALNADGKTCKLSIKNTASEFKYYDFQYGIYKVDPNNDAPTNNTPPLYFYPGVISSDYAATSWDGSGLKSVQGIFNQGIADCVSYVSGTNASGKPSPGTYRVVFFLNGIAQYVSVSDPDGAPIAVPIESTNGSHAAKCVNSAFAPHGAWMYYTEAGVEINPGGYKDVTVVAGDEPESSWNPEKHVVDGKVVTNSGLIDLSQWAAAQTNAPGPGKGGPGPSSTKVYKPGDSVKFSYNIWNPEDNVISDLPWEIGWIGYTANWREKPSYTPISGQDNYSIVSLPGHASIGKRDCQITLPSSFKGLNIVDGKTIKARAGNSIPGVKVPAIDDNAHFLALAVMADPDNVLDEWSNIFGAQPGNDPTDQEISLANNNMFILVPVSGSDLYTTGMGSKIWQKEYTVERAWSSQPDPATMLYTRMNRINITYAFFNTGTQDQTAVPYKIVACQNGSETQGQIIQEGAVDIPAAGQSPDTDLTVDYDALGLGADYTQNITVAVILDPNGIIPEDDETNNSVLFKAGDLNESLEIDVYSPPEGFPLHATGWASITVNRMDARDTVFDAQLRYKVAGDDDYTTATIHVTPGKGPKFSANVTRYSDVMCSIPVTGWVDWTNPKGPQEATDGDLIRFVGAIVPNLPPPPENEQDVIVDINGG